MASNNRTGHKPQQAGVAASFPYDRRTVERFMETFPRARWNDEQKAWFVPGKTAARRIERWLAQEAADQDAYGDQKGRDAFEFDPIRSPYLEPVDADLLVQTPYSRTVVEELRAIAWARWDEDLRVWHVPYRSYEELRRRWHAIEQAARRNEPEARKRRRQERRNTDAGRVARMRSEERRRRRYPVPPGERPPLGVPVSTPAYGIVVFTDITGELAEAKALSAFYPTSMTGRWSGHHGETPISMNSSPHGRHAQILDPSNAAEAGGSRRLANFGQRGALHEGSGCVVPLVRTTARGERSRQGPCTDGGAYLHRRRQQGHGPPGRRHVRQDGRAAGRRRRW